MSSPDEECEQCSKVTLEDDRNVYFSIKKIESDDDGFIWKIILTDGNGVWEAEASEALLSDMAVGSSYTTAEFIALFKMAFNLTKQSDGTILRYKLAKMKVGMDRFFWSIYLPKDDKTFKLGSLDVTPLPESERAPVYCRMFDSLLSVSDSCREQSDVSNQRSEDERRISKAAIQRLDKFVSLQQQSEKVLYTNFVAVLNEKKRKIRELQDQCDTLRQSMGETVSNTVADDIPTKPVKKSKSPTKAPARRKTATVSACTAPAKKKVNKKSAGVKYDSDQTESDQTDIDQESQPIQPSTSKRTRKISSDDDVTDIDELELKPSVSQQKVAEDNDVMSSSADTLPMDQVNLDDERLRPPLSTHDLTRCDVMETDSDILSPPNRQAIKRAAATAASSKKKSVRDELDDLLGDSDPPSSSKQKSPVKRRNVTRAARAVPKASQSKPPAKKSQTQDNDLIDDLLDGM